MRIRLAGLITAAMHVMLHAVGMTDLPLVMVGASATSSLSTSSFVETMKRLDHVRLFLVPKYVFVDSATFFYFGQAIDTGW